MANNYTVGRGEIWFAKFVPGTRTPGPSYYIGNSPEFSATFEVENLEHFNSDRGINEKDADIALRVNRNASFTTDNIDPRNLAYQFFGNTIDFSITGATITDEPIANPVAGGSYQMGVTATNPFGATNLTAHTTGTAKIILKAGAVTMVEGTDYTVDLEKGYFTILPTTAVALGTELLVSYKTTTQTRTRVISGNTPVEGELRYRSYNPEGKQFDWLMPWVKINPNGDYALKGDEWQTIPFSVVILKKEGLEALYIDGLGVST